LSVKSNAALLAAINAADGGSGDARLQISKESVAKTASVFFSDAFSGRAEFGLVGSDAFRLKVSADGSTWTDALIIDQTTGNLALPRGLALTGALAPAQITSNQNDYNPAGLATASLVRLNSDASRDVTGLQGGVDGRLVAVFNIGSNNIVLKDENASSSAANRFAFGADITLGAKQSIVLLYDSTSSRWRPCQPFIAGVSGHVAGYLDGANTWSALQSYTANISLVSMNAKLAINATSGTPSVDFAVAGSTVARVVDDGSEIIVASNAAVSNGMYIVHNTSSWTAVSDARLPWKKTARDITENLPSLASLRVYENEVNGRLEMFVKAQEFYHVAPHFVDVGNDDPDYKPTGIPGKQTWGVNYAGGSVLALGYARKHEAELARLADALDLVKTMRAEIDQLKALVAARK
jgi:hypothetical protein